MSPVGSRTCTIVSALQTSPVFPTGAIKRPSSTPMRTTAAGAMSHTSGRVRAHAFHFPFFSFRVSCPSFVVSSQLSDNPLAHENVTSEAMNCPSSVVSCQLLGGRSQPSGHARSEADSPWSVDGRRFRVERERDEQSCGGARKLYERTHRFSVADCRYSFFQMRLRQKIGRRDGNERSQRDSKIEQTKPRRIRVSRLLSGSIDRFERANRVLLSADTIDQFPLAKRKVRI